MSSDEPSRPVQTVEKAIRAHHPVRDLFLLDVLSDRESRPVLLWAVGVLVVGTLVYHWVEGWNYLDALYFCVISLATIGYGDFTPTTQFGRAFTIIYVINGIVILLALFDRIRIVRTRRISARTRNAEEK
jgi:hypothetical protein